ncbi:hypothetical protein PAHAL_5G485200 [Panicum hallii]|jgi:hypothetical protein|uniref:Late embryogenesis abundant protein LEA-2 subgroup domain-containing protein n=1 Tax=Panicum hallii TaxID=206008 RepID=A0A2S3HY77_9POAL|nr:uncharacterized protein LOC112892836 [Panicum hallii]PAN32405.1 hypothetical protein PAHAL_5G485200 [Panicum hallii]
MGDGDHGRCGACCLCCCICCAKAICNWYAFLAGLALTAVLVAAFGVALPVRAAVTDASLARLDLVGDGPRNGTAAVSLAYNLSLTVMLRNRNWAMRAELAAPLDTELRFAGRRFGGARLAAAGRRIAPRGAEELRVLAAGRLIGGGGGDAAEELARERSAGVFELELRLAGEVRYRPVHVGRSRRLDVTCPVKMMMMAPAPPTAPRGTTHLMVFDKIVTCY